MSNWVAKRFWTDVTIEKQEGGFAVGLDARFVKTPAKAPLVVPSREMAKAVAAEWHLVDEKIDPTLMPFTRSANAAIDKVSVQFNEVAMMLAAYGGSDLLCYRAESPEELVARQCAGWDPLLDWAQATYGARLATTVGIMPVSQGDQALAALTEPLLAASPFELAALHDLIAMSGSLVLALAVTQGRLTALDSWDLSRIDETWQAEQWGADEDAMQVAKVKQTAFLHAAEFYQMANDRAGS